MKRATIIITFIIMSAGAVGAYVYMKPGNTPLMPVETNMPQLSGNEVLEDSPHPLSIQSLRDGNYPGSEIRIEETLAPGSNYDRFIASYESEGNTIYALLTVPNGEKPESGWPVIVFNHGYITPSEYRTTERYVAYVDGFARNGYIVFRSDYRGHGQSEGEATGGYGSNAYTIDILNAIASVKAYEDADPDRIGMWGHSMGGHITLRSMVVNDDIKAGVIWAGVVASYEDLLYRWRRNRPSVTPRPGHWRQALIETYGEPDDNQEFWKSISAHSFLNDLSGPIQLHHGTDDRSVPVEFSEQLARDLETVNKHGEVFVYEGDDHNLSRSFTTAMQRSLNFFDTYVKKRS